jgi:serine/threonine-protein kinase
MSDDPRVQQLLDQLLDSQATPEMVCESCPELLPVVRNRWRQMRRLRADLDALFPPPDEPTTKKDALFPPSSERTSRTAEGTAVPQIPGYEVEAVLGRGGMGVVYRARQVRLNRTVALKMLLAGAYAGPQDLVRFQREAEAEAGLRHPHIVQVHDVGEHDGRPYFTMEFVGGGSLADKLHGTPQPARQAAALVAPLAGAVQAAHQGGIVHRDLKPGNVLLTADGTPKIADFGVARRLKGGEGLTQSGVPMGTPSYMAPEQARGQTRAIGPAADVYALGAILYELLTGRPPFRGETPAETVLQVISQEPVPPSRLNARVPRDLETICLKCLHKTPARRYASAQELADDLSRFLDGKPVRARPVGVAERVVKWARRRPATALLVAALVAMLAAAAGVAAWVHHQEQDRRAAEEHRQGQAREAVSAALRRADDLRREERWREALNVLTDAAPHLAEANAPDLAQRLGQAQSDFRIAGDLERIRESRTLIPSGAIDYRRQAADYAEAFDRAGLRISEAESTLAAIRASAIREQLAAALDDWAVVAFMQGDGPAAGRLLEVARSADPEPRWGDRFRTLAVWESGDRLRELAGDAFTTSPPPPGHQVASLGLLLRAKGGGNRHTLFLIEACRRHPGNFWLSRETGAAMYAENRPEEAAGYYRVARAARPENAGTHEDLGNALLRAGQVEECLAEYRRAVECAPADVSLRGRFIQRLADAGYWTEAAAAYHRGLEIEPGNPILCQFFGPTLMQYHRDDEALAVLNREIEIDPDGGAGYHYLGILFARAGRHEEAVKACRTLVRLAPAGVSSHEQLARELVAVGRPEEAITELQAAVALRRPMASAYMALGALLRSQGRPEEAAAAFQRVTPGDRGPAWEGLAATRLDQGRFAEARAAMEQLLALSEDDAQRRARRRQLEFCDLLLAVEARLPAILAGKERPTEAPAQHAVAVWCLRHKRLPATAAGFYASAFVAQPSLADDLRAGNRFQAACAAALAGCGAGEDAARLDEPRRAELRAQALKWLTADYAAWAVIHRGKPGDRTAAATAVRAWRGAEDLAGVRDEQPLNKLPADERRDWQAFWEKVAALAARDPAEKLAQARAHVARLEWKQAAKCYAEAMELDPTESGSLWFEYAASQLLAEDRSGYRRSCAHILARCQPSGPMRPYLVARACTLAPDSTGDPALPLRLSTNELLDNEPQFWALTEQAALRVRVNRPKDAVPYLERSLVADSRPGRMVLNWLWLALAYQQTGRPVEARRWLDKAANWLDQQNGRMPPETSTTGLHLHNWLEAHALRREAEALLSPR